MKAETNIASVLDANANKDRYDAEVKKILSDKTVLAWIMRETVKEFHGYPVDEIRECIEGTPEVGTRKVLPGHTPEEITGMNTENSVPGEGKVTYDIRFSAFTPDGEHVKLIINVEAQGSFRPGYDLVTRGVFYGARLLSAQHGTEFAGENYDGIKKVYSIWICMDVPKKAEYTITKYHITKEDIHGHADTETRYDLMEVIMICLGREEASSKGTELQRLLSTLLSGKLTPEEKKSILEREYDIATSVELEGGFEKMCNLSDLVEARGIEQGIARGIEQGIEQGIEKGALQTLVSLVKEGILAPDKAAEKAAELGISPDRFYGLLGE